MDNCRLSSDHDENHASSKPKDRPEIAEGKDAFKLNATLGVLTTPSFKPLGEGW